MFGKKDEKFPLGKKVRDKVSGFEGIATAEHRYLNGCVRISVQGPAKDGKVPDSESFDIGQLDVVDEPGVDIKPKNTGGPVREKTPKF